MNWSKGLSASYYAYILDPITWRETEKLNIIGGSISRSDDGLRESADITIIGFEGTERWVRVYLDASQDGASAHVPLFTGLAVSPEREIEGNYEENTLECYSVVKPAQDILLDRGHYVPADINGATVIRNLLSVIPSEVVTIGAAPDIRTSIVAEEGETRLSMVDKVLDVINWRMRILGDGTIELSPHPIEPIADFDPLLNDIIEPSITVSRDWYDCPNVFRAIQGNLVAIARDDNPNSPLSTVSRGREIWSEETSPSLNTGEGISEYAKRRLKELQSVDVVASYTRRFVPDVTIGDLVRLHYPSQGLEGVFKITSQSIDIGYSPNVEEEVEKYENSETTN